MLKIKDNVDLKELEKYRFKPKYNEDTGELWKYQNRHFTYIYVVIKNRELNISIDYIHNEKEEEIYDLLFDLIKDGLVEKVDN